MVSTLGVEKSVFPNVDFYSGIVYTAMGIPATEPGADPSAPPEGALAYTVSVEYAGNALLAPNAPDAVTTLYPTKDNWLDQEHNKDNHGPDETLYVKPRSDKAWRAIIQFDLGELPPNAIISSASLTLQQTGVGTSPTTETFQIFALTESWVEEAADGKDTVSNWTRREVGTNWTTAGGTYTGNGGAMARVVGPSNVFMRSG